MRTFLDLLYKSVRHRSLTLLIETLFVIENRLPASDNTGSGLEALPNPWGQ
jgi:hypothetical protein